MKPDKNALKLIVGGFVIGIINGLFGAGGGMLAVPLLKSSGMSQKNAHANSIAVIFPLCCVSAVLYFLKGNIEFASALPLIPFGIIGALLGTLILKKINPKWLKRIFALFMLYAGIRMLLR